MIHMLYCIRSVHSRSLTIFSRDISLIRRDFGVFSTGGAAVVAVFSGVKFSLFKFRIYFASCTFDDVGFKNESITMGKVDC